MLDDPMQDDALFINDKLAQVQIESLSNGMYAQLNRVMGYQLKRPETMSRRS